MPLLRTASSAPEARRSVKQLPAPETARAGLYLYLSCWDEAHSTADAVENPDGYFWHAIVHRPERKGRCPAPPPNQGALRSGGADATRFARVPDTADPGNSAYWFRRAGAHPIFPKLGAEAADRGYRPGLAWDPLAFIQFCESARKRPGSKEEQLAREVQLLEWQLLFDHCARGSAC